MKTADTQDHVKYDIKNVSISNSMINDNRQFSSYSIIDQCPLKIYGLFIRNKRREKETARFVARAFFFSIYWMFNLSVE